MPRRTARKSKDKGLGVGDNNRKYRKECKFKVDNIDFPVSYDENIQQCCDEGDYQYIKPKSENKGMCYDPNEKGAKNRKSDFKKFQDKIKQKYVSEQSYQETLDKIAEMEKLPSNLQDKKALSKLRSEKNKKEKLMFAMENDPTKNDYLDWIYQNYDYIPEYPDEPEHPLKNELYTLSQSRIKTGAKYPELKEIFKKDLYTTDKSNIQLLRKYNELDNLLTDIQSLSELQDFDYDKLNIQDFDLVYDIGLPMEQKRMDDFNAKTAVNEHGKNMLDKYAKIKIHHITLYDGIYGELIIPRKKRAACEYGKGTKWCTAAEEENMYDKYTKKGPLFVWIDRRLSKHNKFQFHFEDFVFMDDQDIPIKSDVFHFLLEVDELHSLFVNRLQKTNQLVKFIFKNLRVRSKDEFDRDYASFFSYIQSNQNETYHYYVYYVSIRDKNIETYIIDNNQLETGVEYAKYVIKGRWPELEQLLLSHPYHFDNAEKYAKSVLKQRWPEFEKEILRLFDLQASSAYTPVNYVEKVYKGRWYELEKRLLSHPMYHREAFYYAEQVIKDRWPELEQVLIDGQDIALALAYAEYVIKKPWSELETLLIDNFYDGEKILHHGIQIFHYVKKVLKKRWPLLETILLSQKDLQHAYRYQQKIVKGPWKELELELLKRGDLKTFIYYASTIAKARIPLLEKVLLNDNLFENFNVSKKNRLDYQIMYQEKVIKGKWPELEQFLLNQQDLYDAVLYANEILDGNWPELQIILAKTPLSKKLKAY